MSPCRQEPHHRAQRGAEINVTSEAIGVKGPLGTLTQRAHPLVKVVQNDGQLTFEALGESREANAMSGTMRRARREHGQTVVTKGFEKRLALVGVGYRAQAAGDKLNLSLGFSHPVVHQMPAGVKCETPTQTEIVIKGASRQQVGQVAAERARPTAAPSRTRARACVTSARRSSSRKRRRSNEAMAGIRCLPAAFTASKDS